MGWQLLTSHIPVVMLTDESHWQGTSSDAYLSKPFDARNLLTCVHQLLDNRKKLQQAFREQVIVQPKQLELKGPDELFLKSLLNTLEKNYQNHMFGVEQLTEHLDFNRTQLHRKLKALTNKSPGDFLKQFRLERAKQLLMDGCPVSEVAFKTGFNQSSTFTKAFRDFSGKSAAEFVESNDNSPASH